MKTFDKIDTPNYLNVDKDSLKIQVDEIANSKEACIQINELLVVEYYSQR